MRVTDAIGELAANYDDRFWWHERLQHRLVAPVLNRLHGRDGTEVTDEDWDNLLVLDACRADMFETIAHLPTFDDYERIRSRGSSSPDWIGANFADRHLGDIVYVTANPWVAREAPDVFHRLIDVWSGEQAGDATDDPLEERDLATSPSATVTAEALNEAVRSAAEEYPDKRLIAHYFQPHAPCIGRADGSVKSDDEIDLQLHPGQPLFSGRVGREAVWEAYEENLAYVLHHARNLAAYLGGKSVFTADHGELFGERLWPLPIRGYAHPRDLHHPKLVTVPWAELTHGERREVRTGTTTSAETSSDAVTSRLEELGYL